MLVRMFLLKEESYVIYVRILYTGYLQAGGDRVEREIIRMFYAVESLLLCSGDHLAINDQSRSGVMIKMRRHRLVNGRSGEVEEAADLQHYHVSSWYIVYMTR